MHRVFACECVVVWTECDRLNCCGMDLSTLKFLSRLFINCHACANQGLVGWKWKSNVKLITLEAAPGPFQDCSRRTERWALEIDLFDPRDHVI